MKQSMLRILFLSFLALGCAGCAAPTTEWALGESPDFKTILAAEKGLYRSMVGLSDDDRAAARPLLGLALSGGGARSASVSIGLLEALVENDVFQHVDIMSSNSGGSYAAYWLISRLAWQRHMNEEARKKNKGPATSAPPGTSAELLAPFERRLIYCLPDDHRCLETLSGVKGEGLAAFRSAFKHHEYLKIDQKPLLTFEGSARRSEEKLQSLSSGREPAWSSDPKNATTIHQRWLEESGRQCLYQHSEPLLVTPNVCWGVIFMKVPMGATIGNAVRFVTDMLFDWRVETSLSARAYEDGVKRRFGLHATTFVSSDAGPMFAFENDPQRNSRNYTNASELNRPPAARTTPDTADERNFSQILPLVASEDRKIRSALPVYVITASSAYGRGPAWMRSWGFYSNDIRDVEFEFTPIAMGGGHFGYCPYEELRRESLTNPSLRHLASLWPACLRPVEMNLGRAAQISGAVDTLPPVFDFDVSVLAELMNFKAARYVRNPRVSESQARLHWALPFPFYLVSRWKHDERGTDILLRDGDHADNTGLHALLKRKVQKAIVVDNTFEGKVWSRDIAPDKGETNAQFKDLKRLQRRLFESYGLRLRISGYVAPEAWTLAKIESDPTADPCQQSARSQAKALDINFNPNWKGDDRKWQCYFEAEVRDFDYRSNKVSDAYLFGSVCLVPETNNEECPHGAPRTEVLWIKLSVREECVSSDANIGKDAPISTTRCLRGHRYNRSWSQYFQANRSENNVPHHATVNQEYSPTQYAGLRELGYDLGKVIYRDGDCIDRRICELKICGGSSAKCSFVTGDPLLNLRSNKASDTGEERLSGADH